MIGSLDDAPAVEQMAAIGAALSVYGPLPRERCGCPRCSREQALLHNDLDTPPNPPTPPPVDDPDWDGG